MVAAVWVVEAWAGASLRSWSRPAVLWFSFSLGGAGTMHDHRHPSRLAWLTSRLDVLRTSTAERPAPVRRDARLAFGACWLTVLLVATWGGWQIWRAESHPPAPPAALPAPVVGSTSAPPTAAPGLERSEPSKISIESIKLRAWVDEIGLAPDGTLEVQPFSRANHAAWYRLGPTPGQVGPAVITGHVDTKDGVAVFFYLSRLRPGDEVVITRADGRTATFVVDWLGSFPKWQFPTQLVYGATSYPALRLITCGGVFDRDSGSYEDNIVVFAHLTSHG